MTITGSRITIKILGIPVLTIYRERLSEAAHIDERGASDDDTDTDDVADETELSEHGYAYSCSRCHELLVEGLDEPVDGPTEIELALHHQCPGESRE
ncbi:hypothetical protein OG563_26785 [Nocardia vinacea]|uniref:Uncharacterized protein n=1 Tax=Nocardia vinacea TaxID=96468 RepID=A0ABZ1YII0_9NOCA|nr:hypothetical protein [Nocardia vinacea]